jgi:hypothetical protein
MTTSCPLVSSPDIMGLLGSHMDSGYRIDFERSRIRYQNSAEVIVKVMRLQCPLMTLQAKKAPSL